jgi:hypothetical protein
MRQDFHGDVGQVAARDINNNGGNTHLELDHYTLRSGE